MTTATILYRGLRKIEKARIVARDDDELGRRLAIMEEEGWRVLRIMFHNEGQRELEFT